MPCALYIGRRASNWSIALNAQAAFKAVGSMLTEMAMHGSKTPSQEKLPSQLEASHTTDTTYLLVDVSRPLFIVCGTLSVAQPSILQCRWGQFHLASTS